MGSAILILLFIIFALCSAFSSGSETALFSLSPSTVRTFESSRKKRLRLVAHLLSNPRELLVTILMLNTFVNLFVQNIAANLFGEGSSWLLKVGVPLIVTLIFGEILPKSIAISNNDKIAPKVAPTVALLRNTLGPLRFILTRFTSLIVQITFFFLKRSPDLTQNEMENLLKTSEKHGVLNNEESDLIKGCLHLQKATVKELMQPRGDVLFYDLEDPLSKLSHFFVDKGCSKVPVCHESLEKIEGILTAYPFFIHREKVRTSHDLYPLLKKPFFIPETTLARILLEEFKEKGEDIAIVVDEYGSTTGIITSEDLVEVVVGEISDRRDEKQQYTQSGKDVIIASGKLELNEFEAIFDLSLDSVNKMVTLGGWLTEQLGSIPQAGTKHITDNFLFQILAADPKRIRRVYVRRLSPALGYGDHHV